MSRKDKIRNTRDPRYRSNHRLFHGAIGKFLKRGRIARLKVPEISQEAKVWHSTFYDHFRHIDEAIAEFDHQLKPELRQLAREVQSTGVSLEIAFSKILYFVYVNRAYYDVAVVRSNPVALLEIVSIFRKIVSAGWSNYGPANQAYCFNLLAWEFCGLVCFWGHAEKFNKGKIASHARELTRLAQNTPRRLASVYPHSK